MTWSHELRPETTADWLAGEGFLTVAPDLFHWGGHARCLLASARDYLRRQGRIFDDIEATSRWLDGQPRCSGRVAVLGFCFGGGLAVLLATHGSYAASSVNYGLVPRDVDAVLASACPIIGSFGEDDRGMAASARRLAALAARDPRHEATVYADGSRVSQRPRPCRRPGGAPAHRPVGGRVDGLPA